MTRLNIVVPMAGRGSRFNTAGYDLPKPLLPIHGVPMIELVVNNLRPVRNHRFIFICLSEHIRRYDMSNLLHRIAPDCRLIELDGVTAGAACSVLKAEALIDSDEPLMIANSDQYVDMDINEYVDRGDSCRADGLIMTMIADDPKWSYAVLDGNQKVQRVVEKQVVSNEATVGIYNFRRGSDFVKGANDMIKDELRVNNEFYVAPVYNQLIRLGKTIEVYNIGSAGERMFGLGVPEDLEYFRGQAVSTRAVGCCQTRETA
jgi:NDP-sugar pyrophosphorylase family protein